MEEVLSEAEQNLETLSTYMKTVKLFLRDRSQTILIMEKVILDLDQEVPSKKRRQYIIRAQKIIQRLEILEELDQLFKKSAMSNLVCSFQ